MKQIVFWCFLLSFSMVSGQRDSLPLGTKYREDQVYLSVLYNQLSNQPQGVSGSGFSYGMNIGFIKDIALNSKGNWALGFGLGYAFDSFNHGLQIISKDPDLFSIDNVLTQNTMRFQFLEFPIEVRWRNSNAQRYKFWRIYPGFKFSYNLTNRFSSVSQGQKLEFSNLSSFQKLQYGPTLSVGYDAFNLHLYYTLTSLFKNATLNNEMIDTHMLRIGITIYIL